MNYTLLMIVAATVSFNATAKAQTTKACERCQSIDATIAADDVDRSARYMDVVEKPLSKDPEIQRQEAEAITRATVKWAMGDQYTQEVYVTATRLYPKAMSDALLKQPEQTQRLLRKLIADYNRNPRGNH